MTRAEVCAEIMEMLEAPITPKSAGMLASLMCINHYWPEEGWAERWVKQMRPKARWSRQEVEEAQKAVGDRHDTTLMWAAINATWSDMGKVLEGLGITEPIPVLKLARAFWLEDEDAVEEKMKRYYEEIVKH